MNVSNSARLSYSLMTRDDADIIFKIDQDPEVMRYINGGKITTREEVRNVYIPRMESYTNAKNGWGLWKIAKLENDEVIGFVLVRPMAFFTDSPEYKNLELGWRFTQESWGQGYATEAANNIKQALLAKGGIVKFTAFAMEDNQASIHIMEKLGMIYLKTDLHKDPLGDNEVVFYQLLVK